MTPKTRIIVIVIGLIAALLLISVANIVREKEIDHTNKYLNARIDTLLHEVKRGQRLVQDLKVEIKMREDTIRIFERQLPIIRNNYYTNEKEILTNTDSANRVLRIHNQMLFERDYFNGRFSPKAK